MSIRIATYHDAPAIKSLLEALGYKTSNSLLVHQLENLFGKNDHEVYVYEMHKDVIGFVSVHYLPQLAFDGGLMLITYLSAAETGKEQVSPVRLKTMWPGSQGPENVKGYRYTCWTGGHLRINFMCSKATWSIQNISPSDWFTANKIRIKQIQADKSTRLRR